MPLPLQHSEPGPLLTYLSKLITSQNKKIEMAGRDAEAAVRDMLLTKEGAIFMDLLEKSVALTPTKILDDHRALAARNAQSFILSDLRRIASNETEILAARRAPSTRGAGRNTVAG